MVTQRNCHFRALLFAVVLCALPLLCRHERPPQLLNTRFSAVEKHLDTEGGSHRRVLELARRYVVAGETDKAVAVLKGDLQGRLDPYEAYESHALMIGIFACRREEAAERAAARAALAFDRMLRNVRRDLRRIERELAGCAGAEPELRGRGIASVRELVERKSAILAYAKDPLQVQRLLGDHYFSGGDSERAFLFYDRFYRDLEKPTSSFAAQSMRNFVALLIDRGMAEDALRMQGFLVNLGPRMFSDLARLAEMYYQMGDRVSCLLFLMLLNTAADGASGVHCRESRELLIRLTSELGPEGCGEAMRDLALVFLTGKDLPSIPGIVAEIEGEGVRHFFLDYLEGVSLFVAKEYRRALECFETFNNVYPYLADAHCYAMACMVKIDRVGYAERIVRSGEGAVALKPDSLVADLSKRTLARFIGLGEGETERLLLPSEAGAIIDGFTRRGAPPASLQRLLEALSVSRNPYRFATVELMAGVDTRREEYVTYLKSSCGRLNNSGRRNVREVLARMGEKP